MHLININWPSSKKNDECKSIHLINISLVFMDIRILYNKELVVLYCTVIRRVSCLPRYVLEQLFVSICIL